MYYLKYMPKTGDNLEIQNLKISDELNRKIDIICRFAEFIPGNNN